MSDIATSTYGESARQIPDRSGPSSQKYKHLNTKTQTLTSYEENKIDRRFEMEHTTVDTRQENVYRPFNSAQNNFRDSYGNNLNPDKKFYSH